MTWTAPDITVADEPFVAEERMMAQERLRWQRQTLLRAAFDDLVPEQAEAAYSALVEECAAADRAIAGKALDDTLTHPRFGQMSLRWVYGHMIEEYARHNGHADLLRERLDGATG